MGQPRRSAGERRLTAKGLPRTDRHQFARASEEAPEQNADAVPVIDFGMRDDQVDRVVRTACASR